MLIERREAALKALTARLPLALERRRDALRRRLDLAERSLDALDPERVIARGYAVVRKGGICVPDAAQLRSGETVEIRMRDGDVPAEVL